MEQKDDNLRERLLSRLPQPGNIAAYREETESLLARHEKALFWDKWTAATLAWLGMVLFLVTISSWGPKLDANMKFLLDSIAGALFFVGGIYRVENHVYRSKVDLLKEIKQVQLQVLELQASFQKDGGR